MFPLNTVEIANGRKFLGLAPLKNICALTSSNRKRKLSTRIRTLSCHYPGHLVGNKIANALNALWRVSLSTVVPKSWPVRNCEACAIVKHALMWPTCALTHRQPHRNDARTQLHVGKFSIKLQTKMEANRKMSKMWSILALTPADNAKDTVMSDVVVLSPMHTHTHMCTRHTQILTHKYISCQKSALPSFCQWSAIAAEVVR